MPSLSTPVEILENALAREKDAHAFYAGVLSHTKIEMIQDLLIKLKDAEYKHIQDVEKALADLRLG